MVKFPRSSGILLHPTSLPNDFGIGDMGKSAFDFIDFLERSAQTYWQMLPLGPTGFGDSPYQCFSAFAGNTNLISPDLLFVANLLDSNDIEQRPSFPTNKVKFETVIEWKNSILRKAYENFRLNADPRLTERFQRFTDESADWLDDYALFRAVKSSQGQKLWLEWEAPLRNRETLAIDEIRREMSDEVDAQKFYQFLFFDQWTDLKKYANDKGIQIIGDIPIFVSLDSADVWCNPGEFKLNEDLTPKVVAGVPPDYFSKTGQLWGNPIYNWEKMRADGFRWWVNRINFNLKMFDIVRIDHFRGFSASWEVPGDEKTAENGSWVDVPGWDLFRTLRHELSDLPVIAEDLGVITPDVEELRDQFGFPGMRILQYAFGGDAQNRDLPHNYINNCVAYTGTHDNDTSVGWFRSQVSDNSTREKADIAKEQDFCLSYLNSDGENIHTDMIRAIWGSVANMAIVPLQDILGLPNEARMNLPATTEGNWSWRLRSGSLTDKVAAKLSELTEIYGRS